MLSLKELTATVAIICITVSLPTTTQCDTSYYEKYYSARRFLSLKLRASLVAVNFSVTLTVDEIAIYERVALIGDHKKLGLWRPNDAILLSSTQEHNVWKGTVQLPVNSTINYRYFIASVDTEVNVLHIRRWESHIIARSFKITTTAENRSDAFGWISPQQYEVQRGWLSAGKIVQFKLFRNPLHIDEMRGGREQFRIKIQPISPIMRTLILPSAVAFTEYVRMVYGDSYLRAQPEFGVPYRTDDILIFHSTLSDLKKVAFLLKVYGVQEGSELVHLIGYQYISTDSLHGTEGKFTINLISPVWFNTIGSVQLQYLVISSLPNTTSVDFRTTFVDYWRNNWTSLDVGHRGLGKTFKLQATNAPAAVENTIASMKAAGKLGADLVEFDVMLTSDLVPIIYHDYTVYVCMDSKTPKAKDDLTAVLIKDITYEQLKNLKTYQVIGSKIIEFPAHNTVEQEDQRLFPLFEDFLTKINKSLGFDIEIKWPQQKSTGEYESEQTIDKNTYIDRILDVMQRHGCGRLSFFTSFDADICTLLRFKQNMYPTMFLSPSKTATYADPRSDTIYDTLNNAQAFDLVGIVPNAVFIKNDSSWIEVVAKQNKKIFLWGDDLKDQASIAWFKKQLPTGVIYDRMDLWLPQDKVNIFEMESDLPEYFQLQCSPEIGSIGKGNSTVDSILSKVNLL